MAKLTMIVIVRPNAIECQTYGQYPHDLVEGCLKAKARIVGGGWEFDHPDIEIEVIRYPYVSTKQMHEPLNHAVMVALQDLGLPVRKLRRNYNRPTPKLDWREH